MLKAKDKTGKMSNENNLPLIESLQNEIKRLNRQLSSLMDMTARLEVHDLDHSLHFANQKRLMDFVERITLRMDDDDLMDIIVEEFLIELKADRVSYVLLNDGHSRTLAVSNEAVDKGGKRLPLPYFISIENENPFVKLLFNCLDKGNLQISDWNETIQILADSDIESAMEEEFQAALEDEFGLTGSVDCRVAMAFPIETTLGGRSLFCVQRSHNDQMWSKHQRELFQNMCRYAVTLLDQTQLAEHVRDLKDQLGSLIESMPSAIIGMDLLGTISTWNTKAQEFFGVNEEDAIGKVLWDIVPEYRFIQNAMADVLQVEEDKGLDFEPQPFKKANGNVVYHRANLFTMFSSNRGEVALRIDDVTRTVELNQQLFHSQRMETVGTLAGGLAHDFNNVLGGIVGTASLMKQRLRRLGDEKIDKESFLEDLEIIETCTTRASDMVKRLLTLARKTEMHLEPVNLNATIKSIVTLCQVSFESRIQVKAHFGPEDLWVLADPSQFEQAVLNICVNARDAMQSGGTLLISIAKFEVTDMFRQKHPGCAPNELVKISIKDTGEGIPLDLLDKVFDPFFSTKNEKGTGLGLTIVDAIVKEHNGFVEVSSDIKTGTTFRLYFPITQKTEGPAQAQVTEVVLGKGRILIVDDDEMMRKTTKRILTELGYESTTVANGASSVKMIEDGMAFDLVLLDVDMPGINGLDTAKILRKLIPGLRILFCTGRQHQYEMGDWLSQKNVWLLDKPFDLDKLSSAVRGALGKKSN